MRWLRLLFVLYLAAVLSLTLWPSLDTTAVPGWASATVDFLDGLGIHVDVAFLEASSNVVMFVPFGLLGVPLAAAVRRRRPLWTTALAVAVAGVTLSAAIETAQLAIPGRVSTLQDVLLNGAGALVGAAVAAGVLLLVSGRQDRRRRGGPGRDQAVARDVQAHLDHLGDAAGHANRRD